MTENQFYSLWEKFAESNLIESLPDDVEKFCEEHEITVDYFIEEFMWLYKIKNFDSYRAVLELSYGIKSQSDQELKSYTHYDSLIIIQEGVGIPVSGVIKQDIINQVTHKN